MVLGVGMLALAGGNAGAAEVVVYTSLENDEVVEYLKQAKADMPDLEVKWIRLSTGDLGARMLAEKDNPQADVIWGWAVTNMIPFVKQGLVEPYAPKGVERIPAQFKDPGHHWVAIDLYMAAFCVNTDVAKKKNLPIPASWEDLLKPVYKGEIVMPNPASSGTGYLQISSLLQMKGEAGGWEYLKGLDKNIAQYIKSGSRPAKMAAAGEYAIGLSFEFAVAKLVEQGAPVKLVIPKEGAGYELEANALMKGAKRPAAAKRFLDWAISESAMRQYAKWKAGVTLGGMPTPAYLPGDLTRILYPMNFDWSAGNYERIVKEWERLLLR
ncbi:MAG: ABC transporter substrate-binding protein [candidate division NC10 bacterium]|nr:ABC transporter substrate-binding protein [candidate division NC10 bacterium]